MQSCHKSSLSEKGLYNINSRLVFEKKLKSPNVPAVLDMVNGPLNRGGASGAGGRGFDPQSGHTKDLITGSIEFPSLAFLVTTDSLVSR